MVQPPGKFVEFVTELSEEENALPLEVMAKPLVGQRGRAGDEEREEEDSPPKNRFVPYFAGLELKLGK
ncbi:MAG: hypothetical protein ABSF45_27035 [Terriglobia bacterium]|jgi:hypothetical protein